MPKAIRIEKLSKKYSIYHEQQSPYNTLVETLTRKAKRAIRKAARPFKKLPDDNQYEDFWALKNIDLDIEEGDRVGIIGRNGAGKSTLLKILSRITEPTEGRIMIRGKMASLLEVGTGFHPELTGRENIFLNGAILGMTRKEVLRKFDEIVSFAEIEKFLDTPVKRYSSGMFLRLGFAIAAHVEADILIVDEVLAVGDAPFRSKCLKRLDALSHKGRTVLFVSHDIGSVVSLCNKGVFLDKGIIKDAGPIDQCVSSYMQSIGSLALSWEGTIGDEHVRFYRAALVSNEPREFFYRDDKVVLEVDYEVLQPVSELVLGVGVWNNRSQLLACSHTWDDKRSAPIHYPGRQTAMLSLDPKFFHEGEYIVKLDCFIPNKKRILQDDISLKFPIYMRESDNRSTHGYEKAGISLGGSWSIKARV